MALREAFVTTRKIARLSTCQKTKSKQNAALQRHFCMLLRLGAVDIDPLQGTSVPFRGPDSATGAACLAMLGTAPIPPKAGQPATIADGGFSSRYKSASTCAGAIASEYPHSPRRKACALFSMDLSS